MDSASYVYAPQGACFGCSVLGWLGKGLTPARRERMVTSTVNVTDNADVWSASSAANWSDGEEDGRPKVASAKRGRRGSSGDRSRARKVRSNARMVTLQRDFVIAVRRKASDSDDCMWVDLPSPSAAAAAADSAMTAAARSAPNTSEIQPRLGSVSSIASVGCAGAIAPNIVVNTSKRPLLGVSGIVSMLGRWCGEKRLRGSFV